MSRCIPPSMIFNCGSFLVSCRAPCAMDASCTCPKTVHPGSLGIAGRTWPLKKKGIRGDGFLGWLWDDITNDITIKTLIKTSWLGNHTYDKLYFFLVLEVIINHSLGTSLTHVGLSLSDDMLKGVFFFQTQLAPFIGFSKVRLHHSGKIPGNCWFSHDSVRMFQVLAAAI